MYTAVFCFDDSQLVTSPVLERFVCVVSGEVQLHVNCNVCQ